MVGIRWAATAGVAAIGIGGAVAVAAVFIAADDAPTRPPDETPAATATLETPAATTPTSSPGTTPGAPASTTLAPPTPAPTPPPVGPYPPGTRTGDPVVDAVITAVEAGDADGIFDLIQYVPVECDNPNMGQVQPPGTFQCPGNEPDGTEIPALHGVNGAVYPEGDPAIVFDSR